MAQKKQMSAAKDHIKAGKDLHLAEQSMRTLLKDSSNRANPKIWLLLCQSIERQYIKANEKLYLKQKYDTAAFFQITKRMYQTVNAFDSMNVATQKQQKVFLKNREKYAAFLHSIRPNLYNGGVYYMNKQKYADAYAFFDDYIESANYPILQEYNYHTTDSIIPYAAYLSMSCGYQMKNVKQIMKHLGRAEQCKPFLHQVRQYEAEGFLMEKDTTRYIQVLEKGVTEYPASNYFFPRIIEYYSKKRDFDKALLLCDNALKTDTTNLLFRLTRSTVLLNLSQYDECINICQQIIEEDSTSADAYFNLGLAYFDKALEIEKTPQRRTKRKEMMTLYKTALPYLEQYRLLAPEEKQKWFAPLYTIYLNLNMGKEFEALDKLRN